MTDSNRTFELYRDGVLLGTIVLAPDECDFPWMVGYLKPSPQYAAVKEVFERELCSGESVQSSVALKAMHDGSRIEVIGMHVEGNRVAWR
jgi:hypothetical protein